MPDIVIPEAVLEEFLRSLFAKVTQEREKLIAETVADLEIFRAQMNAGYERKIERLFCAVEEDLERKARAADEELERKARAAEDEIARLRQLERLRHTYEAEREPESRLQ